MEKVSIIVPVYNGEAHLTRCAESILAQDYPELELILVDDGSRDASFELMREIAARDTRVKAIHKENGGSPLPAIAALTRRPAVISSFRMWTTGSPSTRQSSLCARSRRQTRIL